MKSKVIIFKKFIGNIVFQRDLFIELDIVPPAGEVMEAEIADLYIFLKNNNLCFEDGDIYLQKPNDKLIGIANIV